MQILEPVDNPQVRYYSSISQHSNKLHVVKGGELVPISYDVLDYIECDKVHSHRAIVAHGEDIGYNYDVKECCFYTDQYIYHDNQRTELRTLPHWFGEGFYEVANNEFDFINADNGSLGERNKYTLRIGTRYAKADKTLKAVD